MTNFLVTGGAGFIGANFIQYWLSRHSADSVVVLDALTYAGNLASLEPVLSSPRVVFVRGDIGTPGLAESLVRDHRLTVIIHFAAESHVDRSIAGPDPFLQTNVLGTHELLKAARLTSCGFHHISTDEVYGSLGPDDPPVTEESPYRPSSPYAASKAAADHLVRAYHRTYGLPITITNCSNNYGPYQFPEKLIPLAIVNALEGRPIPIYGDGQQVRDWLYVEDHCRALEQVLGTEPKGDTYNIGGRTTLTNLAAVRLLSMLIDEAFAADPGLSRRFPRSPAAQGRTASLITHVTDRPGHDRRYAMNAEKIENELGFRPAETFESGIRRTLTWYLAHEEWWRRVMDGSYREWMRAQYGSIVSF
ncbi:MAG TPA: dTDP-glucose 4,6-dehydratase [Gemmatimonadales bacterium]|nr:dTDP-glucose 4,6-dehydratase [Gemmatimonadales bacterium]